MAAAAPAPTHRAESSPVPFRFVGSGSELFRIWIANLALSIVTLGIYSAWAKVRINRYLWSSTQLGDASFAYLASPMAILKGRALVVAFFAVSFALSALLPVLEFFFALLIAGLLPWAVVRSLVFRARNTSYRNIRFDFRGTYGEAIAAFLLRPLLIPLTLGIAYPFVVRAQKQLVIGRSAYGTAPFVFGATGGEFFRIYLRAVAILLLAGLLVGGAIALAGDTAGPILAGLLGLPLYLYLFAFISAETHNLVYGRTSLAGHRLACAMKPAEVFRLYLTNTLGILFTLGIFIPWARVRLARYRLESMMLLPAGDLDTFVAGQTAEVESIGAELGDMLDLDLGL